ncbi:MAG: porin [Methylotetracoccus sp.]
MMKANRIAITIAALAGGIGAAPAYAALQLYVDQKTKQIFAEPGPGRVALGTFKQVDGEGSDDLDQMIEQKKDELKKLDKRMKSVENKVQKAEEEKKAKASADKKWHEKYTIGGYTQIRFDGLVNGVNSHLLQTPTDRGIGGQNDLLMRRARLKLSGDVSDWLSIYTQVDFASTISGVSGTNSTSQANYAQIRDLYADIYFDKEREFRIRPGYSKVPFGWDILQSSQNRLAFERADAVDSTIVRDERDLGAFFYWSPEEAQDRFKYLVKSGLRGSGDYGVFGFGYFNGQGLNRFELNNSMHTAVRVTYPFEIPGDQMLEVGASGITGRYMNSPTALTYTPIGAASAITTTPTVTCQKNVQGGTSGGSPTGNSGGCNDERVAVHAILYPKPFGLQAEWAWGHTPMLDEASVQLGKPVVTGGSLNGGYVQAMYKLDHFYGSWMPYFRYEQYDGGSKFDSNSPHMKTSQYEMGVEYMPLPEFQLKAAYSLMARTNLNQTTAISGLNRNLPYGYYSGNVVRLQLQWNY